MAVGKRRFGWALRPVGTGSTGPDHSGTVRDDDPLASGAGEPIDMAQVRADDAFVEALAKANRGAEADPLDERMASLLLSWRDDVGVEASKPLIDLETAVAAVRNAPRPADRQIFGPLAAAAAVLVIAFTGVGLAARDAVPGNPLFGVTKVLYSDKAKSVEAAVAVRTKLEVASEALASGRVGEAQDAIEQAQSKLPVVAAEDGQGDLVARTELLITELSRLNPTTTPPVPSASVSPAPTTVETTPSPSQTSTPPPTTPPSEPPTPTTEDSVGTSPPTTAAPGAGEGGDEIKPDEGAPEGSDPGGTPSGSEPAG